MKDSPASNAEDLLEYRRNVFSQNGEDGIIEEIFRRIGVETRTCCEFGAWDGIYLSNCRKLILEGWRALMIEADAQRATTLMQNYRDNPAVTCVKRLVDHDQNSLGAIARETQFPQSLDFLSIDVDGLDWEIFEGLDLRPRLICIEVNAGFSPDSDEELPRPIAAKDVGQPMKVFLRIAKAKGYELVCYTSNAFFVRADILRQHGLKPVPPADAYACFIKHLERDLREYMYLVNRGWVPPYRKFNNPKLTAKSLGIRSTRAVPILRTAAKAFNVRASGYVRSRVRKLGGLNRGGGGG
jgi:hypothetical protein